MSTDGAGDETGSGVEFGVDTDFGLRFVFVIPLFRLSRCELGHTQPSTASKRITNAKFPLCARLELNLDTIELFLFLSPHFLQFSFQFYPSKFNLPFPFQGIQFNPSCLGTIIIFEHV